MAQKPKLEIVRNGANPTLLTKEDVAYLQYLLGNYNALRIRIEGVHATKGDPSSLYRVLQGVERKLRSRGILVDSFSNGGHYA